MPTDDEPERIEGETVGLAEPPKGVIAGENVPRENDAEDYERIYEELKEARLRELELESEAGER